MAAIGLAALEFFQGQRRPKLGLFLIGVGADSPSKQPTVEAAISPDGFAGLDFSLMLDNSGRDAARWIKVKITATDVEGMITRIVAFQLLENASAGPWSRGSSRMTYNFTGNDSFVSYARPKGIDYWPDWLDPLGEFRVIVQTEPGFGGTAARFACSIWADGVRRKDETLTLAIGYRSTTE